MNRTTGFIYDCVKIIAYTLVCAVLLFTFVFRVIIVDGGSMYNTLKDKQRVLVTPYNYDVSTPSRGDIVALASSEIVNESDDKNISALYDKSLIKRIIAVAGDTIGFDTVNGRVYINGKIIDEPYVYGGATNKGVQWDIPDVIPNGYVFVMGDNRGVSIDSRSGNVRLIKTTEIIGKAQFVLYPFSDFEYLY